MEKEDVIAKIEKLLRLAESPNEHEAALAASRAQDLMEKYQIEAIQLREDDGKAGLGIADHTIVSYKRIEGWKKLFFCALARVYECKPYYLGKTLNVIGMETDIVLFREAYAFLDRVIEHHAKKEKIARRKREAVRISRAEAHAYRRGFCSGMSIRIVSRLREEKEKRLQNKVEVRDLVVIKEDAIREYTADWNWGKAKPTRYTVNDAAYSKGYQVGGQVNLSVPNGSLS